MLNTVSIFAKPECLIVWVCKWLCKNMCASPEKFSFLLTWRVSLRGRRVVYFLFIYKFFFTRSRKKLVMPWTYIVPDTRAIFLTSSTFFVCFQTAVRHFHRLSWWNTSCFFYFFITKPNVIMFWYVASRNPEYSSLKIKSHYFNEVSTRN